MQRLIPLLPPLMVDSESIIRQHLASQLLHLALTCMFGDDADFDPNDNSQRHARKYNEEGYRIVTSTILNHMNVLITDADIDVRKAASDALASLALYIKTNDVASTIMPIPLRLLHENINSSNNDNNNNNSSNVTKQTEKNDENDDFLITATNLLGDIASLDSTQIPPALVAQYITPTIVSLSQHASFRVRRATVQSLPRVIHGSSINDMERNLIPCFVKLSEDDVYRVRKSVGECLVDMSRSLMLLPYLPKAREKDPIYSKMNNEQILEVVMEMRRHKLVSICMKLLKDSNKFVRNGMMQFLGPFIASFYLLEGKRNKIDGNDSTNTHGIVKILDGENKENKVGGISVQFFPHADGMVSRLNPSSISAAAIKKYKTSKATNGTEDEKSAQYWESMLPQFLEKSYNDAKSLVLILRHKKRYPTSRKDIKIVTEKLLQPYVDLASAAFGDENVDAEMRVYCAYSLPAVVLLLGQDGWHTSLKKCFLELIMGNNGSALSEESISVPLPVKRCLASSFHTICHVLGSDALKGSEKDLLPIFESSFLRDGDDTVRLNIIRNLPSFFSLLSHSKRSKYLPVLYEIITGDAMLASKRKNAMNPMILNWRQRDMIAQIIPNLIILYKPSQVREYIWPIVKILMSDSVNHVREHVEWSIPVILRCYETKKCKFDCDDISAASKFSAEACNEVFVFLKATLLDSNPNANQSNGFVKVKTSGSFSKRQSYCRVLCAVALILRLNDREIRRQRRKDLKDLPLHPFYNLSSDEHTHVYHILRELLLPSAIVMKDDRVTNVRLALAKCLRVMPKLIRDQGEVKVVLSTLEDEIYTWEGGGGQYIDGIKPSPPSPSSKQSKHESLAVNQLKTNISPKRPISIADAQAAIERGRLRAEEDEMHLRPDYGDEDGTLASI